MALWKQYMLNKLYNSDNKKKFIICFILAAGILIVYWQVNHFGFVNIDDNIYVTENKHVQYKNVFEEFAWAFSIKDFGWDPLTFISLILDYRFHGLNAGGYHLTNLILHILSSLLLFWLFNRMTKAVWRSAFVAAFFAFHPFHVESVAWIAERKDVLCAFFWMLTLCFYVWYTEKPVIKRFSLVLFAFILALMSKPMVVTLPIVMILLDYWPLKRFESQKTNLIIWQLKEKLPFFVLSVVSSIITIYARPTLDIQEIPITSRLANAFVSFATYTGKTFWPYDLTVFYPFPSQIPGLPVIGSLLLFILITIFVIVWAKRTPYIFVGWLWYSLTIALTL
jgi:protein O-mannosyl-transferase